ncbi:MAG: ATP-binding protein [Sphingorhabdus sp.]
MAPDTDLQKNEPNGLRLGWSRHLSLTSRILAVNLFVLALAAGGLFFLDSYRTRLIDENKRAAVMEAGVIAETLPLIAPNNRDAYISKLASLHDSRIRLYDREGRKTLDSFELAVPTYRLRDPSKEAWRKKTARFLDEAFDFLVMAPKLAVFSEPEEDTAKSWPELHGLIVGKPIAKVRLAPDVTHMVSAGALFPDGTATILTTNNVRDIRLFVRAERFNIGMFFLLVLGIAILLSLFLARTIVRPIRHLAHAAMKVRLGRAQEVTIPRLPTRRDEIGLLARALSDMTVALRQRIDATEAFAADVAHEIKNPLASLRSALDGLDSVEDEKLCKQLMDVAKADVQRIDRLISDISEASRVEAQLVKAKFEPIDVGDMIEQLLAVRESRQPSKDIEIAFARPRRGVAIVMGEDIRIERALNNLIDNAVSFSPKGGLIEISATNAEGQILIRITDEGPGVPESEREAIFRRFHSERPASEDFGSHSGLGLAIARTIVEGHQGHIAVRGREDGQPGACFEIALPSAEAARG